MSDIAKMLRERLGARGAKAPTRTLPKFLVKLLVPFMPQLKTLAPLIGRRFGVSNGKARRDARVQAKAGSGDDRGLRTEFVGGDLPSPLRGGSANDDLAKQSERETGWGWRRGPEL